MKTLLTLVSVILCALLINPSKSISQNASVRLQSLGAISNVNLKSDYTYYNFDVNQNYLIWYEGYMHNVFIYNLNNQRIKKIELKEGRGPQEFVEVFDITILPNNNIYLTDNINQKLIRLEPAGEYLNDFVFSSKIRPVKYIAHENYNVVMDVFKQDAVFYVKVKSRYIPLIVSGVYGSGGSSNIFKKEGYVTLNKDYLIHVTKYYPYLYVYDLGKRSFSKKVKFDKSKIEHGKKSSRSDGATILAPPSKVDILSEDVASIPKAPHRIFLLAEGKSENRSYDLDTLYEYDFVKEEFVAAHALGVEATEITVNENYLFLYSEEENKIFKYKIVPSR